MAGAGHCAVRLRARRGSRPQCQTIPALTLTVEVQHGQLAEP